MKTSKKEKIQLELHAGMLKEIRGYFKRATNEDIALFIEETVRYVFKKEGDEAHNLSFEQAMDAIEGEKVEKLIAIIQNNLSPNMKGNLISLAEKLTEQGVQKGLYQGELKWKVEGKLEGIREGELKGKLEIAKCMLAEGSHPVFVEKVTGFSSKQIKTLKLKGNIISSFF